MKASFTAASILSILAAAPAVSAAPTWGNTTVAGRANPPPVWEVTLDERSTLSRRATPPADYEEYLCNTQGDSPGTSNIKIASEKLAAFDDSKICSSGENGAEVGMVTATGVKLQIGSVGGAQVGSIKCNALPTTFVKLVGWCGQLNNGDVRAGGSAWVPGLEGKTYVFATDR